MDFREFILNEMVVEKFGSNPSHFIAFRSHLWLYDQLNKDQTEKIYKTIISEHPSKELEKDTGQGNNWWTMDDHTDLERWVDDYIPDAWTGQWSNASKTITPYSPQLSVPSSPLIKKVCQALGARQIYSSQEYTNGNINWETQKRYTKKDLLGKIGEIAYHGTCTEYFPSIFKNGLFPGESVSNYDNIQHDEYIFLSSTFAEAEGHAVHTANTVNGNRNKNRAKNRRYGEAFPMVLQIKIPDRAKIGPDYDADLYSTNDPVFPDFGGEKRSYSSVSNMKTSTHLGLFSYKGRIPSEFIQKYYLRVNGKWTSIRPKTLRNRMFDMGSDWQYYYRLDGGE